MEHIIEILIMIIGITLIIGLITPSFSSNILGKIPDPIGSLLKNINSRKKVLLVYGGIFILLSILLGTDPFESGKKYYDNEDWSGAVRTLSEVPIGDENYEEAQKLLLVAKENLKEKEFDEKGEQIFVNAKTAIEEENWDKAYELLSEFPQNHRLFTEANNIIRIVNGRRNQQKFIDEWKSIKESNDYDRGEKHLKKNKLKVDKWYGEVIKPGFFQTIYQSELLVSYKGIDYTLHPAMPLDESEEKNLKTIERDRDKVLFSGFLDGEKSVSISGAINEPEMKVKCLKITNTDETIIYYEITQEEIIAAEKAAAKAKAEADRRSRLCNLDGCTRDGKGWYYYTESQGNYFGYEMIGCVKKYTTGGYCSKNHCAEDR